MAQKKPKDYYKILGVNHTATDKEIKSAYRSLARKYHPDVNQGDTESELMFKEVSEAYSVLSDEKQRYMIDLALGFKINDTPQARKPFRPSVPPNSNPAEKNKKAGPKKTTQKQKDSGIADAFSTLFDNIIKNAEASGTTSRPKTSPKFSTDPPKPDEDAVTYTDTARRARPSRSQRGEDITLDIYLVKDEAVNGTIKTINIVHTDPCKKCRATGIFAGSKCYQCEGKGEKSIHKKLDVKIPAGIKQGSKVRIAKEGNSGPNEGDRGDLYLIIKLYNPSHFEFDGTNVLSEVTLAPHEAVLGAEIQVLTIDGFVKMKIPPATQVGQKFRLVGQGLPDKNSQRGNHFVRIAIEVPSKISDKEKDLYEQIAKITKFNPREYIE